MLAVQVDLLTDRYVATAYNDRSLPEWPPHPARFFSALVATWAEDQNEDQAAALRWLAEQSPPQVFASQAFARTSVPVYVPVNDLNTVSQPVKARNAVAAAQGSLEEAESDSKAGERAKARLRKAQQGLARDTLRAAEVPSSPTKADFKRMQAVLPSGRLRQPRTFPSVTPVRPRFWFVWESAPEGSLLEALSELCSSVTRLGHSSSLVMVRVVERPEGEPLEPNESGAVVLRVPVAGQLDALVRGFEQHRGEDPRVLPCSFVRYGERRGTGPAPSPSSDFGSDWIVLERVGGDDFPITASAKLAKTLRAALLRYAEEPISSALSGHEADGSPTSRSHVATTTLPFVGSSHADGRILGIALVLPSELTTEERRAVLRAIGNWEESARRGGGGDDETPILRLLLGPAGTMLLRRRSFGSAPQVALRPETWTGPSKQWASATAIALDRNPGDLNHHSVDRRKLAFKQAEATVAHSCIRIGLPEPISVEVTRSTVLPGSEKPARFGPFPSEKHRIRRVLVHALLTFAEPVEGPLLLGAGRFLGLGLCRPVPMGSGKP